MSSMEREMRSALINDGYGNVRDVLQAMRGKGVRLWAENGRLRYQAPKGAVTPDEIECLRAARGEIAALLEDSTTPTPAVGEAPLSFSQLTHWRLYRLDVRPAIRQIVSATRLDGDLDVDALRTVLDALVQRHEALRTHIVAGRNEPVQSIAATGTCEFQIDDLTEFPREQLDAEIARRIARHIMEPIDIASGPLFGARLLRLGDRDHVLVLAMEHMISDAFSMGILVREIFSSYGQVVTSRSIELPPVPVRFADYAARERKQRTTWLDAHESYWRERLVGYGRTHFPDDDGALLMHRSGWGFVPITIGSDQRAALREWCRSRQTTLAMSVFTAFVALVLRWCDCRDSVVQYQSDGRTNPDVENTIGYFSSVLYLRLAIDRRTTFADLLRHVTTEYCNAHGHADSSLLMAELPRPAFTRNALFNWVPLGSPPVPQELDGTPHELSATPVRFPHPMLETVEWDFEPTVLLYDTGEEIVGKVSYPRSRMLPQTMERFARNFGRLVEMMTTQPDVRVMSIELD